VAELVRAGLTDVHLSLHGATHEVHDYHTGVPGSFVEATAALAAARAHGLTVVATTVLTRSNFRVLATIPALLSSKGAAAWTIAVPHARGRADASFDRVVPRLAIALPFALHALEAARALGLPAWISGAPSCLLGPLGSRALPSARRAYAECCQACPARSDCPGVDDSYLARFGAGEISPRAPVERKPANEELAQMFVGPGELAPMSEAQPVEVPAPRKLPLLGKVQAARGEVSARSERRTGEALREILPELFEPKKR
jgi:hypothetical protein